MKKLLFLVFIGVLFVSCQSPVAPGFTEASVPTTDTVDPGTFELPVVYSFYEEPETVVIRKVYYHRARFVLNVQSNDCILNAFEWSVPDGFEFVPQSSRSDVSCYIYNDMAYEPESLEQRAQRYKTHVETSLKIRS